MNLNRIHSIFFIGIGGIGMSALARYFNHLGKTISGYDLTPTPLTDKLISEGMHICYEEDLNNLPAETDLAIYTPAIPKDNIFFNYFKNKTSIPLLKRSELLGMISEDKVTIAVAGTHGKTSISALTAHLLQSSGIHVTALFGGISKNFRSNVTLSDKPEVMVLEADEFDRSFLTLSPDIAVISSMDEDHLDVYNNISSLQEGFREFTKKIKPRGLLICQSKLKTKLAFNGKSVSYSADECSGADVYAENIAITEGRFIFDFVSEALRIDQINLHVPGMHYIENALAAMIIGRQLGLSEKQLKHGIESFEGVERRFDTLYSGDVIYIDDYAHHPEEIRATIQAVRMLYPEKKVTGVFQPHLYSRTLDLAPEFASVLSTLDEVILLDIYPAREKPIPGVSSAMILNQITGVPKNIMTETALIQYVKKLHEGVLLTLGAGDIGLLARKIKNYLTDR